MTSQVMVFMTERGHKEGMKNSSSNGSAVLPLVLLVGFTAFSVACAWEGRADGLAALKHPWAIQIFADLFVSCVFVGSWMHRDARARGISALPFLVLLPFLGSIATLLYLVRRTWSPARATAHVARAALV